MTLEQLAQLSPAQWFFDVRDQLKNHVYGRSERAFAAGDAGRDALATAEQVAERQACVRERFAASLGGLPSSDTPLEPVITGVIQRDGFRIEKVIYQSRPRHYVTANLYVPDGLEGPTGAVLFLCGHAEVAKAYPEYQAVCQRLALAGLVVLAQDPIGQGERLSYWDAAGRSATVGACCPEHDHAGAQCVPLGDFLARYFAHDAMRGLDYLSSRPEVDPARLGVTGNSGGGTQSSLLMLLDPRLAAAAPGTFIMNRATYQRTGGAQDAEQIWPGFTAAGCDHEDIVMAMAPKPVRVLAVTDDFFPIEGTRRTVQRCKRIWGLFGREECVDLVEDVSGHAYTPPLARAATAFFTRHLLGREVVVDEGRVAPLAASDLWCTRSGQVQGEVAGAEFAFEANLGRLQEVTAARTAGLSAEAADWLREQVLRDRTPCDLNPRVYLRTDWEGLPVEARVWWSQEGLMGHSLLFRPAEAADDAPLTVAVWDGGCSDVASHAEAIRSACAAGRAVMVLDVSGMGALKPFPLNDAYPSEGFYGVIHKLSDDLMWLGDSLCALRVYDVLRALDLAVIIPGLDARRIDVLAAGKCGIYGRLAAALDDRIASVDLAGVPTSCAAWVGERLYDSDTVKALLLPGMLRWFDLADLPAGPR
jgi:cephalosporin-C deacetylase-like acetyl esterase